MLTCISLIYYNTSLVAYIKLINYPTYSISFLSLVHYKRPQLSPLICHCLLPSQLTINFNFIELRQKKTNTMNSCGNAYCHGGSCTCGVYYGQNNGTSAYSMYYSQYQNDENYSENMYSFISSPSSSSSSVDCTLSLGTPSTRLTTNENHEKRVHESSSTTHERRSSSSYMSKCWNILQKKTNSSAHKTAGCSSNNNIGNVNNADPLVARRCANCDTTSTPLWRNGPRGPKVI